LLLADITLIDKGISMQKLILTLSVLLMFISSQADANTNYGDPSKIWPGFNYSPNSDVIGVPNITGLYFTFDKHELINIKIEYVFESDIYYYGHYAHEAFAPGDWFFNVDADIDWDYVLTTSSNSRTKDTFADLKNVRNDSNWLEYEYVNGLPYARSDSYILAGSSLYPDKWSGRTGHPALAQLPSDVTASKIFFSGWGWDWNGTNGNPKVGSTYSATWDLSSAPIDFGDMGGEFIYGFSLTCANDVLYGRAPIPTPEPGTALLLGVALLGLGATIRRRR
jgi:hypothetical protein